LGFGRLAKQLAIFGAEALDPDDPAIKAKDRRNAERQFHPFRHEFGDDPAQQARRHRRPDQRINNWRWALVWAAAPAGLLGWAVTEFLPEWAELAFGIPAILGLYCWIIWANGFGPEDRKLFRKTAKSQAA